MTSHGIAFALVTLSILCVFAIRPAVADQLPAGTASTQSFPPTPTPSPTPKPIASTNPSPTPKPAAPQRVVARPNAKPRVLPTPNPSVLNDKLVVTTGYTALFANNNSGSDYAIQGDYHLSHTQTISAGFQETQRIYTGAAPLTDNSFSLANVSTLTKRVYLEDRVTLAPNASFLPLWSAQSVPHYVLRNGNEVAVGFKFSHYDGSDVGTVSPSYLVPINDYWMTAVQINLIQTYHTISSEQIFLQYAPSPRHTMRITGATGRAIEGIGLEGDFTSVALNYKFRMTPHWALLPNFSVYRGSVRNEIDAGLGLEWAP